MDEEDRLIAIAALADPDRAVAAWHQWRATVPIAEATDLLVWAGGYIHRNLSSAGVDEPYLAGIYRHNLISNTRRLRAALPVITAISSRWTIVPLKSFGMTGETYSRGLRPLADIDFWVDPGSVLGVADALEQHGLRPLLDIGRHEFVNRVLPQRGSWNYVAPAGVDLDLHWRLLEHLDHETSQHLIDDNTTRVDTEVGSVLRLSDELMLSCLVAHFRLQGPLLGNGLFDVAHLIDRVDPRRAAQLAARAGVARELAETADQVRDIVGDDPRPALDALARELEPAAQAQAPLRFVNAPRFGDRIPARFDETPYLAYPALYRWWTACGRPAWLERAVAFFGGFTRVRSASEPNRVAPPIDGAGSAVLGVGWRYRYPGDDYRWANLPDARVVFVGPARSTRHLRIELAPFAWSVSPGSTVVVRANGRRVGTITRDVSHIDLPVSMSRIHRHLEISLRPERDRRHLGGGVNEQWFRAMAPVRRIALH